jgi:hypothetical protein
MTWTTHTDRIYRLVPALLLLAVTLSLAPLAAAQPASPDSDGDRLFDADETGIYGTTPSVYDTDGDGVGDGEEVSLGTDPLTPNAAMVRVDSDGDGLYDDDEVNVYGTSANNPDTDGDGGPDGTEVKEGLDPLVKNISTSHVEGLLPPVDSDGDGLDDGTEATYGTDPTRSDTDGDGLSDSEEINVFGTSPTMRDTDGNGSTDWEDAAALAARTTDGDGDGVSDADEFNRGTDPYTPEQAPVLEEPATEEGFEEPEAAGGGGDDIDEVENKADPCHPQDGHPNDVCMEEGEQPEN